MIVRDRFSTRSVDDAVPALGRYFPALEISRPRGRFLFELESRDADAFSALEFILECAGARSAVDTEGMIIVGQLRAGVLDLEGPDGSIDATQPWIYPNGESVGRWDDLHLRAVTLSVDEVNRYAAGIVGRDEVSVRFTSLSPRTPALAQQWTLVSSAVVAGLAEGGSIDSSPLVSASAFAHLASTLFATFPNSVTDIPNIDAPTSAAVRRALEFMEGNAHLPITSWDVARAVDVSVRALQYAFRDQLGETPTSHLRAIRLRRAHDELSGADPATNSVRDIALKWGFGHAGRFSQSYRLAYGLEPSRTLADG